MFTRCYKSFFIAFTLSEFDYLVSCYLLIIRIMDLL